MDSCLHALTQGAQQKQRLGANFRTLLSELPQNRSRSLELRSLLRFRPHVWPALRHLSVMSFETGMPSAA